MITEILTIPDVEEFVRQLVGEGTNAHPDEDFNNYVNMETGLPAYTPAEAAERNRLTEQCFMVCEAEKRDVYDVMQEVFLIALAVPTIILTIVCSIALHHWVEYPMIRRGAEIADRFSAAGDIRMAALFRRHVYLRGRA